MKCNGLSQTRRDSSSWVWLLILSFSIMLLLIVMEAEILYVVLAALPGLAALIWNMSIKVHKCYRNRHPWQLTFQVLQPGDTEHRGRRQTSLQIELGLHSLQVELSVKAPTELSSGATIVMGEKQASFWDAVHSRIKKRHFKVSLASISSMLSCERHFRTAESDCPVQIRSVEDCTPSRFARHRQFKAEKLEGTSGWGLDYGDPTTVGAGHRIILRLHIEACKPWKGYIVFSSDIQGQRRKAYGEIEVISNT
jgi:hypothetical protein